MLLEAATPGIATAGMLADGVALQRGTTCKRVLLHVLLPAGAMPGFPLPGGKDCKNGGEAIGGSPN